MLALVTFQNPESLLSPHEVSASDGRERQTYHQTLPVKGRFEKPNRNDVILLRHPSDCVRPTSTPLRGISLRLTCRAVV